MSITISGALSLKRRTILFNIIIILPIITILMHVRMNKQWLRTSNRYENDTSWSPFNVSVPHVHWCPADVTCHNSPLCEPCQRRFLLLLATPRSGSTSLLEMLNVLPNVRLSGENNNVLHAAWKVEETIKGKNGHKMLDRKSDKIEGAWQHNSIPEGSISCFMQKILHTINPPPFAVQEDQKVDVSSYDDSTILGAKMVRFHTGDWTAWEAAAFLKKNFPCARIVINIRSDLLSQQRSQVKTFGGSTSLNDMKVSNKFYQNLSRNLGNGTARLIDMMDWTADVGGSGVMNDVVKWLGFRDCVFGEIIHENYDGFGKDKKKRSFGKDCRYAP